MKRVLILGVISFGLKLKRVWFLHTFLEFCISQFLKEATFFIAIGQSIYKSSLQCL